MPVNKPSENGPRACRAKNRKPNRPQSLCIVAPCFNEAELIDQFYHRLKRALDTIEDLRYRILFVDDGSTDATLERLNALASRYKQVLVYSFSRNFGHQAALSAGLDFARGDAVILMDSDLQHPPELIPQMVQRWREGYDVVSAVRDHTADASWFKRLTSDAFYRFFNRLSETQLVSGAADFCLLSRRARRALCQMPERHRFLRGMISWIGFRRSCLSYQAPPRAAGRSKYTLLRMLAFAGGAVFSFSAKPIRLATQVGLAIAAAGILYLAYVLLRFFIWHDVVRGWSSVIGVILILGGFQLIFIGLIGEYVARIFEQVKSRPHYLLKQRPTGRRAPAADRSASGFPRGKRDGRSQRAPGSTKHDPTSPAAS